MNGELVKKAREVEGKTQSELAEACGLTQAAIARIEQNFLMPSDETARIIADVLRFPIEYFYQNSFVDIPSGSGLFRCLRGLKSKDRSQIVQTASVAFQMYRSMADKLKLKRSVFPKIGPADVYLAPSILRNALGIEEGKPVTQILKRLENIGVVVISVPLEIHEHDGLSMWIEDRPVIVLSRGKSGDRQRRTVVHEMFHLACHYAISGVDIDELETEADALTDEFLMPEEVISGEIPSPVTLSELADLKGRWGTSIQSLIERGNTLQIISANQRKYLYKQINQRGWNKREPMYIEPERPRALQLMTEMLYKHNEKVIYSDLAKDVLLPNRLVHGILSAYNGYSGTSENAANVINFALRDNNAEPLTLFSTETEGKNILKFRRS